MAGSASDFNLKFDDMAQLIKDLTSEVQTALSDIRSKGKQAETGIFAMFDLQMKMNKLAQASEMSTGVMQAFHQAIQSVSRGLK